MKHKPIFTLEVLVVGLLVLNVILMVWAVVQTPTWWLLVPLAVWLAFLGILVFCGRSLRAALARWLTGSVFDESKLKFSLGKMSAPTVMLSGKTILWYNEAFQNELGCGENYLLHSATKVLPGLTLSTSGSPAGQLLHLDDRIWHAYSSTVEGHSETISIVCFTDETNLRFVEKEYTASRPGCIVFAVDGYSDVFNDMLDSERAGVLENLYKVLETTIGGTTGFLQRLGGGKYLAVVEERHLNKLAEERYAVLDEVRAIAPEKNLSLSIGVGRGAETLVQARALAEQALDMAQGRGGDQTAEKTPDGFTFYGGVSHGVEKRSRVKSRLVARALVELIKQSESVVIMGHRMSDLDAIGSAEGVLRICKICDVPAVIAVRRNATMAASLLDAFAQAGCGNDFMEPEKALETVNKKTLCIVVDTYLRHLVESQEILDKAGSVVVIDHHRKGDNYIKDTVLLCHEPYASSASELVAEMLAYVGDKDDKPTRLEAEGMLAGIMLDTHDFSLHTGVRTFEAAATLRRYGAETENVRALFHVSRDEYVAKCELVEDAQVYKGCAISLHEAFDASAQVAIPQAANDLLTISGVRASFVGVENANGVNISARSMGQVNVQVIMEALGGGGHQTMAGAQLRDISLEQAGARIRAAIDLYEAARAQNTKT